MPRISQLPSLTVPDSGDELAIVDTSAATTKKISRTDFLKGAPLPADTVTTAAIQDGAVTTTKVDFTTLSATEKVVGIWVDGKTIYQRVFSGSISQATNTRNSETISTGSIDSLISAKGYWAIGSSGITAVIGGSDPIGRYSAVAKGSDGTSVVLVTQSNAARTSEPYVIAIEYTKP